MTNKVITVHWKLLQICNFLNYTETIVLDFSKIMGDAFPPWKKVQDGVPSPRHYTPGYSHSVI